MHASFIRYVRRCLCPHRNANAPLRSSNAFALIWYPSRVSSLARSNIPLGSFYPHFRHKHETTDELPISYRLVGSVLTLRRLCAKTKSSTTIVFNLLYVDDAALHSLNVYGLQRNLSTMNEPYNRVRLITRTTVVMCQPLPVSPHTEHTFLVGEEPILKWMSLLTWPPFQGRNQLIFFGRTDCNLMFYLTSKRVFENCSCSVSPCLRPCIILSTSCSITDEIQNRIRKATSGSAAEFS